MVKAINPFSENFKNITTFVFDIDGVMTDGSVHVLETGEHYRVFHIRDGYAIERAVQAGYRICVITGGKHEGVRKRLQNLKITMFLWVRAEKVS